MAIPENIEKLANDIRTKIYGKDVREALASGIEAAGETAEDARIKSEDTEKRQTSIEKQFDDQIANMTLADPSSAELVAARTNVNTGKSYDTIGRRLDAEHADVTAQLEETINDENDYILYSFFKSNSDTSTGLFISTDGENIKRINAENLDVANLRDPSICTFNGWYLIAYTAFNPFDFKVSRSKDLVNWTTHEISVGFYQNDYNKIWAPEWFIDDNKLYLLLSNREGEDVPDIEGNLIPNFKPYITECVDLDSLTFSSPTLLNLGTGNKIDPCMIKHNNEYYLFIKDEYDKCIESWKSSTLDGDYTKISDNIEPLYYTEGLSIIKKKDLFYLYGDSWKNDIGVTYFATSSDLINWSERKQLKTKERIRHGTACVVNDNKAKDILRKFINANIVVDNNEKKLNLYTLSNQGIISNLELIDEMMYYVAGNEKVTINSISNPYNAKEFFLYIASNADASIEIANGSGVVSVPSGTTYDASFGDGDTIIKFVWVDHLGAFKPDSPNLNKIYYKKIAPAPLDTLLGSLATNGQISSLEIKEGMVYTIRDNEHITINNFTNPNKAKHFYFYIASDTTGSVTITSGSGIVGVPTNTKYDVMYGFGNCLIEFVWVESKGNFKPLVPDNKLLYDIIQKPLGWKTVPLTTQTISLLDVEDGVIYKVDGGNHVGINGIANKPAGYRFGLLLTSEGSGSITLKDGPNLTVPDGVLEINIGNNLHDRVIKFVNVFGSGFRLEG